MIVLFSMIIQNGGDATSAIRMSGFDGLIVGLTGNALDDNVDIFLHAGADCVIAKPLRAAQMDALIQHTNIHGMKSQTPSKFRLETTLDHNCVIRFL